MPYGVAVGMRGNVFVADTYNQTIRTITAAGAVQTIGGKLGQSGWLDGTSSSAKFSYPWGMTVDAQGNLYVCDSYAIRKFVFVSQDTLATAMVTTVAGQSAPGHADGAGTAASFQRPAGIVAASDGTLYVADTYNHTIRTISPAGVVTTLAGTAGERGSVDGTGTAARFDQPAGIALDHAGNLYVADSRNHTIRKIAPDGAVTTIAGTAGVADCVDGFGSTARFRTPFGVAVDSSDNVFVADEGNSLIRKITPARVVSTFVGSLSSADGHDGTGPGASFYAPMHLAIDAQDNLYVAEYGHSQIRKITPDGITTTLAGSVPNSGSTDANGVAARFNGPYGSALDPSGALYVADYGNHTIRKIAADGMVTTYAGQAGVAGATEGYRSDARFDGPTSVALDASGNLFVADQFNRRIRKISAEGMVTTLASGFSAPMGVATDRSGNVYATDYDWSTIHKISPSGATTVIAGAVNQRGSTDAAGDAARFNGPAGLVVDPGSGDLYVADCGNNTVRRITSAGVVTTVAGKAGEQGGTDGTGASARFGGPWAITIADGGNLYVAEISSIVRKITPEGTVTTLGGSFLDDANVDGAGRQARFNWVRGIAVDSSGALYLSDSRNNAIRKAVVPAIAWQTPGATAYGTALSAAQLNATSNIAGTFSYSPALGTLLTTGSHTLTVSFTIGVAPELPPLTTQVMLTVNKADPAVTWARPAAMTYGAALSSAQLRAMASVAGSFSYTPELGAVLHAGDDQMLRVTFTPTDTANYNSISATTTVTVAKAPLTATAIDRTKIVGQPNPVLMVEYTGFVNGDSVACIDSPPGASTTATSSSPAGAYPITLAGGADADYALTLQNGTLTVEVGAVAPAIATQPAPATAAAGSDVSFSVRVSGTPSPNLRWQESVDGGGTWRDLADGGSFSGVTTQTLTIAGAPVALNGRRYRCTATNSAGSTSSAAATLTVAGAPGAERLANISARAYCGTGNSVTIGGFVVTGSAPKRVLIRAVGPTLTTQGIGQNEVLQDPVIEVHHGASIVAQNDNWGDNANAADITAVARTIGANALAAGDTQSSALLTTLNAGVYTFVVKGKNDTAGIVLLEVYDADTVASDSKFVDIAARAYATTGNGVAIGGFVISGNAPKRILMRAVGPTLTTQGIGQTEALHDPLIELHHGSATAATNDDWGSNANATEIRTTAARIGATALASSDTTSSALLMTLDPGVYTFIAKGKNDTSGIVLVEVYDAD